MKEKHHEAKAERRNSGKKTKNLYMSSDCITFDGFNKTLNIYLEFKTVKKQALTKQLIRYINAAHSLGGTFELLLPEGTIISKPLLKAAGKGILRITILENM